MKILFYSTKAFERSFLEQANKEHIVTFTTEPLSSLTIDLAKDYECISIFTEDTADATVLRALHKTGVHYIALRAADYDNVDLQEANNLGIHIANVPINEPHAVVEHALCLLLALSRKIFRAHEQVQQYNFSLDNLIGFELAGKKVGIIGTGKIGSEMAKILHVLGCTILAYDLYRNEQLENRYNVYYVGLHTLCSMSDIITLHVPLNKETKHLLTSQFFSMMKKGVVLINTASGAVIDTNALIECLEIGHIGAVGLDVYENEKGIFFHDTSHKVLTDPILLKLMSFNNVIITPHQGFATQESLTHMAITIYENISCWVKGNRCENQITYGLQNELTSEYQKNKNES